MPPVVVRNVPIKKGTQLIYVPTHAEGDIHHPDAEWGFAMGEPKDGSVFCRYWRNPYVNGQLSNLRTRANSESTPLQCIVTAEYMLQSIVDCVINEIEIERAKEQS